MDFFGKLKNKLFNHEMDADLLAWKSSSNPMLTEDQLKSWDENGFLVLEKFFSDDRINGVNKLIDELWNKRKDSNLVIDAFIGTDKERRMKFADAEDVVRNEPYKLNDLFLEYKEVRDLVLDPKLCLAMADLLEGDPMVCNGLSFERGSQQDFHFDTFYMPPPVENKMVATWIALEDATAESGPLRYYPGSHNIEPYHFSDGRLNAIEDEMDAFNEYIREQLDFFSLEPVTFLPDKGDVLIWHAQLLHGGDVIEDKELTRKSLVSHYFRASDFPPDRVHTYEKGRHMLLREHQGVSDI